MRLEHEDPAGELMLFCNNCAGSVRVSIPAFQTIDFAILANVQGNAIVIPEPSAMSQSLSRYSFGESVRIV